MDCSTTVKAKGYPGEQLPRWAFALYWRGDGLPLWENQDLIVSESVARPAMIEDAEKLMPGLCTKLGLPSDSGIPAYEDPAHFLLVERKLPINGTAEANRLDDPAERERIARVFDRGLSQVASYVLPIQAWQTADRGRRWVTER